MNKLILHKGSRDYLDSILNSIRQAKEEIAIILYTLNPGSAGNEFIAALCEASSRGVDVRILLDAVGSEKLTKKLEQKMISAGVSLQFFNKVKLTKIQNIARRIHIKLFIFDRSKAFVGGINISDEYFGTGGKKAWLDYAVEIEGNSCKDLYLRTRRYFGDTKEGLGSSSLFLLQDFWRGRNEINKEIKLKIGKAEKKVVLLTPYFFPPRFLYQAIKKALSRGVKVDLVLSRKLDIPILSRAMKFYYSSLLQMGVNLFEWTGPILHAKLICVDSSWTCIGSFNLDHLSSFNNIELNLAIEDEEFNERIHSELHDNVLTQIEEIKLNEWHRKHGFFMRVITAVIFYGLILLRQILIRKETRDF